MGKRSVERGRLGEVLVVVATVIALAVVVAAVPGIALQVLFALVLVRDHSVEVVVANPVAFPAVAQRPVWAGQWDHKQGL